ncbi:MAG: OmpA family protein [Bacteroidetes bacterium]|jgi:OOP family OmpA-OmpF porin|nr:OmpA family protein [Bacteroidota bacterium]MDF1864435.1 OmpA family protein [Saprospiraceae bacterium]
MRYLKQHILLVTFFLLFNFSSKETFSQVDIFTPKQRAAYSATPPHMWEVGVNTGTLISFGDIDFVPGFGAGVHVRKALDYVFSLRADAQFGQFKGDDAERTHTTNFKVGSLQMLMSLNNLVWNTDAKRMFNMYLLMGAGMNSFSTKVNGTGLRPAENSWVSQLEAGGGFAFRVTDRFNIGIESKLYVLLGAGFRADLIDGLDQADNDIPTYTSIRMNFNIGDADEKSEPLYWINPMDVVLKDISELKARPTFDLTDSDDDGVVDMLDREQNTPKGAPVDTRGIALDSDGDNVPDYRDREPYSRPNQAVDMNGVAINQIEEEILTEEKVRDIISEVLRNEGIKDVKNSTDAIVDWFLPMIHFEADGIQVRKADFGNLASISKILQSHPNIRLVVTGYTDKTASNTYNDVLSYNRAKNVIDHLVKSHSIPRNRLILQYSGEEATLVPESGSSFMNRRVEFRVAIQGDIEMMEPNKKPKKKGF